MSFRSIGVLADEVLRKSELAARASKSRSNWNEAGSGEATASMQPTTGGMSELGGGPTKGGERQPAVPVEGRPGKPNGKGRGTVKATASEGRVGRYQRRNVKLASTPAHLRLIVRNDGRGLPHAAAMKGLARPGSRPSIRIVGGTHYTASGFR